MEDKRERFDNLDGLRTISCLGIIVMHIKANSNYNISGYFFNTFIPSWTLLVYLFLMISGFGMFCGYYEKIKSNNIDLNKFYIKRYSKILPFFALLILIDIIMERSITHIIEGITEATMVFGLLPNNQPEVVGVGWTLGVIFLFYMLFPFVVWLNWNKKRALISFIISIILNYFCEIYYFKEKFVIDSFAPRHSFIYCATYFLCGGIIYLYRNEIKEFVARNRCFFFLGCLILTIVYYCLIHSRLSLDHPGAILLFVFLPWMMYAISVKSTFLSNKIMKYISGISLELYLAQMFVYRGIERIIGLYILGTGWSSFIFICVITVIGLIIFIEIWKKMNSVIRNKIA